MAEMQGNGDATNHCSRRGAGRGHGVSQATGDATVVVAQPRLATPPSPPDAWPRWTWRCSSRRWSTTCARTNTYASAPDGAELPAGRHHRFLRRKLKRGARAGGAGPGAGPQRQPWRVSRSRASRPRWRRSSTNDRRRHALHRHFRRDGGPLDAASRVLKPRSDQSSTWTVSRPKARPTSTAAWPPRPSSC